MAGKFFPPSVVIEDPGWAPLKDTGDGGGILRSLWGWGEAKGPHFEKKKRPKKVVLE